MTTLASLLFEPPVSASPTDTLVSAGDRHVTRAAIIEEALIVRDTLQHAGVSLGAPIAAMLDNEPETIGALFGVWAAGAVYVPVNPRLADPEVARLLGAVPPAMVLTTPEHASRFSDAVDPGRFVVLESTTGRIDPRGTLAREAASDVRTFDADVALVQTTSGTTGPPKPVALRHSQVLRLLDGVLETVRGADKPRDAPAMSTLLPVSLSLWAGIYNVLFAFRVGAPIVLMRRFEPRELARLVAEYGIRSVVLPPAAMAMCCDDDALTSLAPLRYVRSITAPLSPFLARRFHDRFGVAILNCYGQTELGGEVVGWSAADWREFGETKLGAVGRPHAGVEVRIDEEGELWVRTPVSSASDAGASDRATADGWVRTGDEARIDDDGFVWIDGRVSDMVNRGGLKVFPAEVEEVLLQARGVHDVAVVGVPDDRLGEVPVAAIVGDAADAELEAHCRAHVAPYKVPVRFVHVDALPRNDVGKVLRTQVRNMLNAGEN